MQLHGFKNQQQKHTLKQCFEETQVNNTPFRLAVPLIFFDHSFITIHQFDGQLRIDIVIKSYAHVLHDVSITIVKEIKFYRSFHH